MTDNITVTQAFEREERYVVFKLKDLTDHQRQTLKDMRELQGWPTVHGVVVESDWQIYERVWDLIEQQAADRLSTQQEAKAVEGDVVEALQEIKKAARYTPIGDGYFDPYADSVEAVDAAVEAALAALTKSQDKTAELLREARERLYAVTLVKPIDHVDGMTPLELAQHVATQAIARIDDHLSQGESA